MVTIPSVLTRDRLVALLRAMRAVRVAVVGDVVMDVYWEADMTLSRLARENPHYVLPIVRERLSPGAGSNVAAGMAALGVATVHHLGVVGDDWRGRELLRLLPEHGVNTQFLLTSADRVTNAFCKPLRYGICEAVYEDPHLYFENRSPNPPAVEAALLERLDALLDAVDAVVVADYLEYGALTEPLIARLNAAGRAGLRILVDSRPRLTHYHHVILKPNELEAVWAVQPPCDPHAVAPAQLADIARQLARQQEATVCLTLGDGGCLWVADDTVRHIPTRPAPPPIDTVGAGDAFAGACVAALAAGADGPEAAALAHLVSGVTVRKLGTTGTATPAEILQRFDEDDA